MVNNGLWLDSHCPTRSSSLLRSRKLSYRKVSNSFTSTARSAHFLGAVDLAPWNPKTESDTGLSFLDLACQKTYDTCPTCFFCKTLGLRKFSQQHLWVDLEDVPTEKTQHLLTQLLISKGLIQFFSPNLRLAWWLKLKNGHGSTWLTKITRIYN
jgi:hypothetical protein